MVFSQWMAKPKIEKAINKYKFQYTRIHKPNVCKWATSSTRMRVKVTPRIRECSTHWTAAFHIRAYLSGSGHQYHVKRHPLIGLIFISHRQSPAYVLVTENRITWDTPSLVLYSNYLVSPITLTWSQKQFIDPFLWPTLGDRISVIAFILFLLFCPNVSLKMSVILLGTLWIPN